MPLLDDLLKVADTYARARKVSRSRVSTQVFNEWKKLDALTNGADLATRRFEAAMSWFSLNWPIGVAWPRGVARPWVPQEANRKGRK